MISVDRKNNICFLWLSSGKFQTGVGKTWAAEIASRRK
jgi:hypothetical protein